MGPAEEGLGCASRSAACIGGNARLSGIVVVVDPVMKGAVVEVLCSLCLRWKQAGLVQRGCFFHVGV